MQLRFMSLTLIHLRIKQLENKTKCTQYCHVFITNVNIAVIEAVNCSCIYKR